MYDHTCRLDNGFGSRLAPSKVHSVLSVHAAISAPAALCVFHDRLTCSFSTVCSVYALMYYSSKDLSSTFLASCSNTLHVMFLQLLSGTFQRCCYYLVHIIILIMAKTSAKDHIGFPVCQCFVFLIESIVLLIIDRIIGFHPLTPL